ncbi:hypothetical protein M3Y97_00948300 [Aphelenchoides bicaudatus]|nr:hypothetical protein M3Y97_00948300 [Aphelenchoides bicaudatus]
MMKKNGTNCDCSSNRMQNGNAYQPVPIRPIDNEHQATAPPYISDYSQDIPPPSNPNYAENTYAYVSYAVSTIDGVPKKKNRLMFYLCLIELFLAAFVFAGGIWCVSVKHTYCSFYSAIWSAIVLLINAVVGIVTSRLDRSNWYIAHLIWSILSVAVCIFGGIVSMQTWLTLGDKNVIQPNYGYDNLCIIDTFNRHRIDLAALRPKYPFESCLWALRVGLSVSVVQFCVTAVLFSMESASVVLCLYRVCNK